MTKKRNLAIIITAIIIVIAGGGVFMWQKLKKAPMCTLIAMPGLIIQLQDKDGNRIADAKINSGQQSFYIHEDGSYRGLIEGRGKYEFTIEKDGFKTYTGSVDLKHDECHVISQNQNIILQKTNE